MNTKRKKNLTYLTIAVFFFLGGVEYAVILPTLWLYLDTRFNAEPYVLGLIMSAFSLSGLIAGPLMGRWSDQTGQTKWILLFANLWEVVGSIMYFLGINEWFLVAARLVAGVGTGVGSAIFADIARVTSTDERTAVMAVFMAVRQIGLLIGPGCNLFLRELNISLGPFILDKYTAPGINKGNSKGRKLKIDVQTYAQLKMAFMALMWLLHELMTVFLYWDLPKLILAEQEDVTKEQMAYTYSHADDPRLAPPVPSPSLQDTPNFTESEGGFSSQSLERSDSEYSGKKTINRNISSIDVDLLLTSSNEMIESAERFICMDPEDDTNPQEEVSHELEQKNSKSNTSHNDRDKHVQNGSVVGRSHPSGNESLLEATSPRQGYDSLCEHGNQGNRSSTGSYLPDITVAPGNHPATNNANEKKEVQTWTWSYYYEEYFREEVIALLATVFVSFFNQVAMETMITPLTQRLLGWGELENSLLYCAAGVEIMLVFALIRWLSRKIPDRHLLLFGFFIETATIAFLLWFIPQAREYDVKGNLPWMIVGLVADLFGLPFLVVVSASLYSKITSEKTQGFSQGLRRSFGGLGCIMGPLWAGSLLSSRTKLYIMVGVMLGVNMIIMCTGVWVAALWQGSKCCIHVQIYLAMLVTGLSQGLKSSADRIGTVMGPLWVGSTLNDPFLMVGVMLSIMILAWVLLLMSFGKLKQSYYLDPGPGQAKTRKNSASPSSSLSPECERTPLLSQRT